MQDRRSKATYYRCKSVYGRMEIAQINQLRQYPDDLRFRELPTFHLLFSFPYFHCFTGERSFWLDQFYGARLWLLSGWEAWLRIGKVTGHLEIEQLWAQNAYSI